MMHRACGVRSSAVARGSLDRLLRVDAIFRLADGVHPHANSQRHHYFSRSGQYTQTQIYTTLAHHVAMHPLEAAEAVSCDTYKCSMKGLARRQCGADESLKRKMHH